VNVARATLDAALLALLATAKIGGQPAFQETYSYVKPYDQITAANMPALCLSHSGEKADQAVAFGMTRWMILYDAFIFFRRDASPDNPFNVTVASFLDAVDAAMAVVQGEKQTLNGLVTNVWIEGEILIDPGILDQQAAIVIPIKALTGM
jgi:hypothetical protein